MTKTAYVVVPYGAQIAYRDSMLNCGLRMKNYMFNPTSPNQSDSVIERKTSVICRFHKHVMIVNSFDVVDHDWEHIGSVCVDPSSDEDGGLLSDAEKVAIAAQIARALESEATVLNGLENVTRRVNEMIMAWRSDYIQRTKAAKYWRE